MSEISLSKAVRTNLLSLQNTATMMEKTQERLATGNKVNSALDNPSNFFTASALNSRAADMSNLLDSMASGIKVIEAANNGITALTKNLESMQSTLRQARQDKTFQTATFDVTKDSVLNIGGGQFGELTSIKLGNATPGVASTIKTENSYSGPAVTAVSANAEGEGAGARTVLELDAVTDLAGKSIKVDGKTVAFDASDNTIAAAADKLSQVLGADYTVTAGSAAGDENKIVIENAKVTGYASTSPVVELGATAAGKASASFVYDAAKMGAGVKVGNHTIDVSGPTTASEFAASLQSQLNEAEADRYTVTADADNNVITVTDNQAGAGQVQLSGGAFGTIGVNATSTGVDGTVGSDTALQALAGSTITLTAADNTTLSVEITSTTTLAALQASGFGAAYGAEGLDFSRADAQAFTVAVGRTPATTSLVQTAETSKVGTVYADLAALEAARSAAFTTAAGTALGTITLNGGTGKTAVIDLDDNLTVAANFADKLTAAGFTVNYDATNGITFSRTDGEEFEVEYGGGTGAATVFGAGMAGDSTGYGVTAAAVTADQNALNLAAASQAATHADALGYSGADAAAVASTGEGTAAAAGTITITQVPGIAGVTSKSIAAASDEITVTYGNKTANIKVTGAENGGDRSSITKSINDQFKTAGLDNLEATFDTDGKLSITAKNAEAVALTITGPQASAIFGSDTKMTDTGSAAISGYNSKNPVDMFVEEINRNPASMGKIRASNDNGKLRIENLSTQELQVSHDADGAGVLNPVSSKIAGNSVRANLAKQFNDLRDQLDKLADDSSFNGINLLRGDKLTITFNESGSSAIQIQAKDKNGNERPITAASLDLESLISADLDSDESIDALLGKLSTSLSELRSQASSFGSNLSAVQNRQDFTKNMINTLQTGAANLTLADMNEEAANLLALQTRQSLSSSALSMASQADQSILQLLR